MTMRPLTLVLAAGLGLALTWPAKAEPMKCAERQAIVAQLANYREEAEAIGLNKDGTLLEVFVSPQGTWTVLLSSPQGQSCIAAIGEAWQLKITSQRPES
jgi:hypothetical protein